MELSNQIHHLQLRVKELKKQNEGVNEKINLSKEYDIVFCQDDLINVDEIDFSNDETWLCDNSGSSSIKDLSRWLREETCLSKDIDVYSNHLISFRGASESKKIIDSRTFTRPKKKYSRPSIEHYNEEMYDIKQSSTEDVLSQEIQNYMSSSKRTDSLNTSIINEDSDSKYICNKPLHFDLNQPASGNIFDNILMNASDIDSFQNMSPPSLVNSMCSSTFTNLMENSFIKNDPILREIRDADYSNEILMQDSEPPLYQSFTESCSSLNSDSAENFLRRTLPTLNNTFNLHSLQNSTCNSDSECSHNTIVKNEDSGGINVTTLANPQLNGTFIKDNSNKELNYSNNLNNPYAVEGNFNNTFKRDITKDISYDMSSSNNSDIQCDSGGGDVNVAFRKLQNDQCLEVECEADKTFSRESNKSSLTDVYFNSAMSGSTTTKHKLFDKTHSENIDPNTTINTKHSVVLNGTFKKPTKLINTAQKTPNTNVCCINDFSNHNNKTILLENDLDDPINVNINYNITGVSDDFKNCIYNLNSISNRADVKRNSASYVTGSTDSLDHMSSLSNSSRGSNRMLNMAEVDAIVEEQERSLQVMSTPKSAKSMTKLFENHYISPIIRQKEHVSDSDLSSTDDFLTVRSTLSKGSSGHSEKNLKILDKNAKSLSNLKQSPETKLKPHNVYTITKPVINVKPLMGSYTNLRAPDSNIRGSYTNLRAPDSNIRGSYTNLKTVGTTLKGSYTNLKPVGVNLPVITSKPNSAPISGRNIDLDKTHVISNMHKGEVFKVPQVPPAQIKPTIPPVSSVKPQARSSCLPRPVATGIPRPVSKIPGPRMLRPPSARTTSRLASNSNEGYY